MIQKAVSKTSDSAEKQAYFNRIITDDTRRALSKLPSEKVDLSFWSPPYYVGKTYERDLSFADWQTLIKETISCHNTILKPGGFMVVNIGDIICFTDPTMPRFMADNIRRKKHPVTREQALEAKRENPNATRYELAKILGCSEQTVQRRIEHNNVRGGKYEPGTKVLLTGCMVAEWAEQSGLYLYDQRIWRKGPLLGEQSMAFK